MDLNPGSNTEKTSNALSVPAEWAARLLALTNGRLAGRATPGRESVASYRQMQWGHARDALFPYFQAHVPLAGRRVLDMGCGHGGATEYYATRGATLIVGVDRDDALLPRSSRPPVNFLASDVTRLPFGANTFDVAVLDNSLEHFHDPATALREIRRVLRDGGRMFVNFPPWHAPWAHHVYDFIPVPWAHLAFRLETLARAVHLVAERRISAGADPVDVRLWRGRALGHLHGGLNQITVRRFEAVLEETGPWRIVDATVRYWRRWAIPAGVVPGLGKFFMRRIDIVLEKSERRSNGISIAAAFRAPLVDAIKRRLRRRASPSQDA